MFDKTHQNRPFKPLWWKWTSKAHNVHSKQLKKSNIRLWHNIWLDSKTEKPTTRYLDSLKSQPFAYLSGVMSENWRGVHDISKFPTQSKLPSYLTPFTVKLVSLNLHKPNQHKIIHWETQEGRCFRIGIDYSWKRSWSSGTLSMRLIWS